MRLRSVRSSSVSIRSLSRPLALLAAGVVMLAGPALVSPAHAASATAARVACKTPTRTAADRALEDTVDLNAAERARTRAEQTRTVSSRTARTAATVAQLPAHILVPVYVHVIQGSHRREQTVNATKVRRVMAILRGGFSGVQSPWAARTRYSFTLKKMSFTRNDKWYHASLFNPADRREKQTLHRGFSRALNIYIQGPTFEGGTLLGYSRFPWQYPGNPGLDGITVAADSLPGGHYAGFNLGDTVIHETGHWLGLFHTFESSTPDGCDPVNDGVADTPAEVRDNGRRPAECSNPTNVCDPTLLATLVDPVYNFMDYAQDRCMRMFTQGQSDRMDSEYAKYRY